MLNSLLHTILPKVCAHQPSHPYVGFPQSVATGGSANLSRMGFGMLLNYSFTSLKGSILNVFQQDSASVHKALIKSLCNELEC